MIEYHLNWWIESIEKIFNFKLMESDEFFQVELNGNNWVNDHIHSKFNRIDWNWFIWWLNDLNEIFLIFLNLNELKWFFIILNQNIQMNTITISSMIKLKNNQILSIIVKSLWNRIIDKTTNWIVSTEFNWIIKQQHSHFLSNESFVSLWIKLII